MVVAIYDVDLLRSVVLLSADEVTSTRPQPSSPPSWLVGGPLTILPCRRIRRGPGSLAPLVWDGTSRRRIRLPSCAPASRGRTLAVMDSFYYGQPSILVLRSCVACGRPKDAQLSPGSLAFAPSLAAGRDPRSGGALVSGRFRLSSPGPSGAPSWRAVRGRPRPRRLAAWWQTLIYVRVTTATPFTMAYSSGRSGELRAEVLLGISPWSLRASAQGARHGLRTLASGSLTFHSIASARLQQPVLEPGSCSDSPRYGKALLCLESRRCRP